MIELAKYAKLKICVAVSGGKDSMALINYLYTHAGEYEITLSALNCDHKIRETSSRDSAFVRNWCAERKIPLLFFEWNTTEPRTESNARNWRLKCYESALTEQANWSGADVIATAHHMNDNAETVLFNLARGSALSGLTGISDKDFIIRPMIACTREQIDAYIAENKIPFVVDETNFTDDYTRNRIRRRVLPELESAVPNAVNAIYRFSRLAEEDESYFNNIIKERGIIEKTDFGVAVNFCEEKVIFRRAVVKVIKELFNKKDYTFEQAERLYALQFSENSKKFEFLGLTAYKEGNKIVISEESVGHCESVLFKDYKGNNFCGQRFELTSDEAEGKKLAFDYEKIPPSAVIRFMNDGDKFTKFGGGTKSLGDYFTDKKIPVRIRKNIPLIADGNEILAIGGVEISDKIKITENTKKIVYLICTDYVVQGGTYVKRKRNT